MSYLLLSIGLAAGPSPHGQPKRCEACHEPAAEASTAIAFATGHPDGACRACHAADPHQVGLRSERTEIPERMLLLDGRLACFTCHDEPACEGEPVAPDNPRFFRGGPYTSVGALCSECHRTTGQDRFDPHAAMVAEAPDVCEFCHLEVPEPGSTPSLRVSGPNTCLGCHPTSVHAGSERHLVSAPQWAVRGAKAAGLPLDQRGKIVCITCHDPHPASVLGRAPRRPLGRPLLPPRWTTEVLLPTLNERARGEWKAALEDSDYLRLPLGRGELCRACHWGSK